MDIKKMLDTKKVVEYYGFKMDRAGFMPCPFHQEKTASMKIYDGDRGFGCYGCGKFGSVIDFVMGVFNINYHQAVTRLNYDFNLGLKCGKPDRRAAIQHNKEKAAKAKNEELKELIEMYYILEYQINRAKVAINKPTKENPEITSEFADAIVKMNNAEIWLNER